MKVDVILIVNKQPTRLEDNQLAWLAQLDRALRAVIAKVRARFLVKSEFFQVAF